VQDEALQTPMACEANYGNSSKGELFAPSICRFQTGCEKLALSEGYGRQAVHNCGVMNPALAAEWRYSSPNRTFSAASSVGP
jgi:hypothetical protein